MCDVACFDKNISTISFQGRRFPCVCPTRVRENQFRNSSQGGWNLGVLSCVFLVSTSKNPLERCFQSHQFRRMCPQFRRKLSRNLFRGGWYLARFINPRGRVLSFVFLWYKKLSDDIFTKPSCSMCMPPPLRISTEVQPREGGVITCVIYTEIHPRVISRLCYLGKFIPVIPGGVISFVLYIYNTVLTINNAGMMDHRCHEARQTSEIERCQGWNRAEYSTLKPSRWASVKANLVLTSGIFAVACCHHCWQDFGSLNLGKTIFRRRKRQSTKDVG